MVEKRVASRALVPSFHVMNILDRVAQLRTAGHDVVSLCAGEPSGGAPVGVNQAAAELHASGVSLNYTSAFGIAPLRERIAAHYQRWYGTTVNTENIAITTGASGAFMLVFLAAFNAGDRVAMARPGYPAYRNILSALGINVVEIPCDASTRYQPTPELLDEAQAEHGHLDGLILASPANPTGTMVDRAELEALVAWCDAHGARLISDEIYHGITYAPSSEPDARGVSAVEVDPTAVVISSFSKFWGMPGWRLGWAVLPNDLIPGVDALAGNVALCAPAPAQYAAVEAFSEAAYAEGDAAVAEFARTRAFLLEALPRLGWGEVAPADGAFYVYADLGPWLSVWETSTAYCAALLEEAFVALTPGPDFDAEDGDRFVRLSFAAGYDAVFVAVDRILEFQARHAR
ncbi:pyridoxal phosphate-dependent aminotransferase [Neomicrococcus aestuarii]|uniref:Aminotransferase n=1 Tax=Neomicrococcus aestuarii TaxID=556325 RepID=A0A1L2ZPL9_9MICC|nr:aminotransferase class I/II-fold pyridoxal phosphate-dependent enzyme [Neomicrococcus aestuarii]APF41107.1 aspartate aminotransferase [Neomicrococcus aestuarii]